MRLLKFLFPGLVLVLSGCITLGERDRDTLAQYHVAPPLYEKMVRRETITANEIVELSVKHVPPPFIVRYLRGTVAVYRLTSDEVLRLRKAGVSPQVIDYMLATPVLYSPLNDPFWYADDPFWIDYPLLVPVPVHRGHHHGHRH